MSEPSWTRDQIYQAALIHFGDCESGISGVESVLSVLASTYPAPSAFGHEFVAIQTSSGPGSACADCGHEVEDHDPELPHEFDAWSQPADCPPLCWCGLSKGAVVHSYVGL